MGNVQGLEEKQHSRKPSEWSSCSLGDSEKSQQRSIHEKLVREHDKKSNLHDFYEIIDEIGQGGLCKIYKIKKKHDMIGGSSREGNIRHKKGLFASTRHHISRRSSRFSNIPSIFSEPSIRTMPGAPQPPKQQEPLGTPSTISPKRNPKDRVKGVAMAHVVSEPSLSPPWVPNGRKVKKSASAHATSTSSPKELQTTGDDSIHNVMDDDSNQSARSNDSSSVPIPMGVPLGRYAGSRGHLESMDSSDDGRVISFSPGCYGSPVPGHHRTISSTAGSNLYFALKEINLAMVKEDKIDQLKNEVEILKALDHKNIIKAYETFHSKQTKKLMIVMELCTGGDLHSRLPYTEECAARIVRQILSAVSYIHERNIIHRDLKLENVMFENEYPGSIVKLIDFGLSKEYTQKDSILSERVGTLYSMSPETMLGDYNTKADMWSMGVCTYMLLAKGAQPFVGKTPKQMVAKVLVGKYSFEGSDWASISDDAKQFIRDLLVVKPDDRMSANEAKHHAWLQKATENQVREQSGEVYEAFKERVRECIVRYAWSGEFLKLALNVIAKKSSAEDIFELRAIFDEFDVDDSGTLTLDEFKQALGQFKDSKFSEEDIEDIFRKIDVNRSNEINYTEFLAAALETQGNIQEYRLAEAFDLMDSDDSGYISRENLRQIVGEHAGDEYIDQLLSEADFFNDGKISYAEFLQAFNKRNQELVYNMYELERETSHHSSQSERSIDSDEEVLRRFGIIKTIRKAFNSTDALSTMEKPLSGRNRANSNSKRSKVKPPSSWARMENDSEKS